MPEYTTSVLAGGLISIVPQAYFSLYAFRFQGASQAFLVASSSMRGLAGKLALTAAGFALAFGYAEGLHAPTVMLAYIGSWLVQLGWSAYLSRSLDSGQG